MYNVIIVVHAVISCPITVMFFHCYMYIMKICWNKAKVKQIRAYLLIKEMFCHVIFTAETICVNVPILLLFCCIYWFV